jgi:ABC-type Co2+ transport system permease subunit
MGVGALAAWGVWSMDGLPLRVRSFAAGFAGAMLPTVMMASEFYVADYGKGFFAIAALYVVVAVAEGALTTALVDCFKRLKPEVLAAAAA